MVSFYVFKRLGWGSLEELAPLGQAKNFSACVQRITTADRSEPHLSQQTMLIFSVGSPAPFPLYFVTNTAA